MNKQPSLTPEMLSPELAKRVQRFTDKLDEAYPDGDISGFRATHKKWGETASELAKLLDFESSDAFLSAYGYVMEHKKLGGRPAKDFSAVLEDLRTRYPQGAQVRNVAELSRDNPDLAGRLKTLVNSAQKLFGMPLWDYLVQSGIVSGDKHMPRQRMTADEKGNLALRGKKVLDELKRQYYASPAQMHAAAFKKSNRNVDWPLLMAYQQKCTEYTGMEDMLLSEGILQKPMSAHEAMEYIILQLKKRLNSRPFEGNLTQLVCEYADLPFERAASLPVKQHLEEAGLLQKAVPKQLQPIPPKAFSLLMPAVQTPDTLEYADRYFTLLTDRSTWREYRDTLQAKGSIVRFAIGCMNDYIIIPDHGITEGYVKRLEVVREYWPSFILMTESHFRNLLEKEEYK